METGIDARVVGWELDACFCFCEGVVSWVLGERLCDGVWWGEQHFEADDVGCPDH